MSRRGRSATKQVDLRAAGWGKISLVSDGIIHRSMAYAVWT